MLVLSRKVGERIVIDENITVVVQRISGGRVTIGIEAPKSVHILRGELDPFADERGGSLDNAIQAFQAPSAVA